MTNKKRPPVIGRWLLHKIISREIAYSAMGDFDEIFSEIATTKGVFSAHFWYSVQILKSLPPFVKDTLYWSFIMFKNYLKISIRNLKRNKIYSLINISGLAVGIASCLLILLFVKDELSYDKFHNKSENIFRLVSDYSTNGTTEESASTIFPVAKKMAEEFPQVVNVARLHRNDVAGRGPVLLKYEEKEFFEKQFFFADPSLFEIFDFELAKGNAETALLQPNSIIITERMAKKYFDDLDPMGKILTYQGNQALTVTAVAKNPPGNSHIKFDFLVPLELMRQAWLKGGRDIEEMWTWNIAWSYMQLAKKSDADELQKAFPDFVQRNYVETLKSVVKLSLQPLKDIHLHSHLSSEIEANGNVVYIYVFSTIAVLVLLIACINFMNLATAGSSKRAKEIGMRKVMGAYRKNLIRQFLGEAIIMSSLSVVLAVVLVQLSLPVFNVLTGKTLAVNYFNDSFLLYSLMGIGLAVGLLSGSYPAFFHSAVKPIKVLKGKRDLSNRSAPLRKILVVGQFAVSIVLIVVIAIVSNQLEFMKNKDIGFDKEEIIVIRSSRGVSAQFDAFKNTLLQRNEILQVTGSLSVPGSERSPIYNFLIDVEGMENGEQKFMAHIPVQYEFFETFGFEMAEGRKFSRDFGTDMQDAFIINETAARDLNWEHDAVGKQMEVFAQGNSMKKGRVIGVVKDFNYASLHTSIKPVVFTLTPQNNGWVNYFELRIDTNDLAGTAAFLEETWDTFSPGRPVEFFFLNDELDAMYRKEEKMGQIINYFTWLAVFIACFGLYGLASFTAEQRTKEIGVRKVLGATGSTIIKMLSAEYLRLLVIANVIAWPIAYYAMNTWLQEFAYRITINPLTFIMAGMVTLTIVLFAVGIQTVKAARIDPVRSLRYE